MSSALTSMAYCGYPVKKRNPLIIFYSFFILGAYFLSKEGKGVEELQHLFSLLSAFYVIPEISCHRIYLGVMPSD